MNFPHRFRQLALLVCIAAAPVSFAQTPRYTITSVAYAGDMPRNAVVDTNSGLTWRRCAEGQVWNGNTCTGIALTYTYQAALARATSQAPWRLPNRYELFSIVDKSVKNPAIDSTAFPATSASYFWSSSPGGENPTLAWVVGFSGGDSSYAARTDTYPVRLMGWLR